MYLLDNYEAGDIKKFQRLLAGCVGACWSLSALTTPPSSEGGGEVVLCDEIKNNTVRLAKLICLGVRENEDWFLRAVQEKSQDFTPEELVLLSPSCGEEDWFGVAVAAKAADFTPEELVRLSSHFYEEIWFKDKVFKEHNCSRRVCVGASVLAGVAGGAGVGVAAVAPGVVAGLGLGLSVAATGGVGGALVVAAVLVLLIPVIIHRVKYRGRGFAESARGVYGGYSGSLVFGNNSGRGGSSSRSFTVASYSVGDNGRSSFRSSSRGSFQEAVL